MPSLVRCLLLLPAIPLAIACESSSPSPAPQSPSVQSSYDETSVPAQAVTGEPSPAQPDAPKAPVAITSTAPAMTAASPTTRSLPSLETACKQDADCAVGDTTIQGPDACCFGCTWSAGRKASWKALAAACQASPPNSCPPIGCAMPIVEPRCISGRCVASPKKG